MVTIKETAKLAGVSMITVSRVINKSGAVSEKTTRKVLAAIEQLGYRPNHIARSLVTRRTYTIGVLLPGMDNYFYPELVRGIEETVRAAGYNVIISNAYNCEMAVENIELFFNTKVDGIIILPMEFDLERGNRIDQFTEYRRYFEKISERIINEPVHMVLYNEKLCNGIASRVFSDNEVSGVLAVEHLVARGHRVIGHINELWTEGIWEERLNGYRQVRDKHQLDLPEELYVRRAECTVDNAFEATLQLLKLDNPPTAIHAANDIFAIGAMQAIQSKGLQVPGDVSVIGHDGISLGDMVYPKLTSVTFKRHEIGCKCAQLLLNQIEDKGSVQDVVLKPILAEKESTAPVKSNSRK